MLLPDDFQFPPVWADLDALCAPIEPPQMPSGSGPVRENTHADAVVALRQLKTAATMMRQHLEDRPRDDFVLNLLADLFLEATVTAGALVGRFQQLREPAEVVDLAAVRFGRDLTDALDRAAPEA